MSDCILWDKSVNHKGYGRVVIDGVEHSAHRVALAKKLGRPVRKGYHACHSCHTRACVNPDHLYEGTPAENVRDQIRQGTHKAKWAFSDAMIGYIRQMVRLEGMTQTEVARLVGTCQSTVSKIVLGKTRKHLPLDPLPPLVL